MQNRIRVYWNLTRQTFSIQEQGLVSGYSSHIYLKDVRFQVSQAGRNRVLKEKRKNVHAFVTGIQVHWLDMPRLERVRYDPYRNDQFTDQSGKAVFEAAHAELLNGRIYLLGNKEKQNG